MSEWRCFHCDEVFTDRQAAQDHFGISECDKPACKVSPDLAALLRMQETELYKHRSEQTELGLLYYKLGTEHYTALRKEEQRGYDKGLADGIALSKSLIESIHCLIFSMVERGITGDDPWWGQDFLRVKNELQNAGYSCEPTENISVEATEETEADPT